VLCHSWLDQESRFVFKKFFIELDTLSQSLITQYVDDESIFMVDLHKTKSPTEAGHSNNESK
jgi:hypothetical protein